MLIIIKDTEKTVAGNIRFANSDKLLHRGNNVWQVDNVGIVTQELPRTVTNELTNTVTHQKYVTNVTQPFYLTKWKEISKPGGRTLTDQRQKVYTRTVTAPSLGSLTLTKEVTKEVSVPTYCGYKSITIQIAGLPDSCAQSGGVGDADWSAWNGTHVVPAFSQEQYWWHFRKSIGGGHVDIGVSSVRDQAEYINATEDPGYGEWLDTAGPGHGPACGSAGGSWAVNTAFCFPQQSPAPTVTILSWNP